MAVDKKTRTSSAHGPSSVKSAYKAKTVSTPAGKKPYTPASKSANSTKSSTESSSIPRSKRKADDDAAPASAEEKPAVVKSLLNAPEEIDFPRGGGTTLTQVEVYEAQLEGDNEARAEEQVSPFSSSASPAGVELTLAGHPFAGARGGGRSRRRQVKGEAAKARARAQDGDQGEECPAKGRLPG